MHFVSTPTNPVKVKITAEHFGGRTSTHYVVVGRGPGEGVLTVRERAAAEYRRKFGLGTRIVAFEVNCG
jgi:hypothetical protein